MVPCSPLTFPRAAPAPAPQAEQLRGHLVYCAASDRDALRDPDEFYVTDIIGCTVVDQVGTRRGGPGRG
jgi:ribosomal 30S subunit maturation factor RimM